MPRASVLFTSAAALVAALFLPASAARAQETFPFVLPWDDASPRLTDCAPFSESPAGKNGPLHVGADGHIYAGAKRIRFLGVNTTADAGMPTHEEAEKIAARMAKFGINAVRLHFLDATWGRGMVQKNGELNEESFDRLGYFVAQLKKHGIYSNINLLVGRRFTSADKGLPVAIDKLEWKESHIPGFFNEAHRRLQQDYARTLLTRKNPHTGLSFAEDPGVGFVEINNENGLIQSWLGGEVDKLPAEFQSQLQTQWNAWLKARYGSDEKLKAAWNTREIPLGPELFTNTAFGENLKAWTLEKHEGAEASATAIDGNAVRIVVGKKGAESWHVQFNQRGLKLSGGEPCTLKIRARSSAPLTARVAVGQAHEPWKELGLSSALPLTSEWREFSFVFTPTQSDENARVSFSSLGSGDGASVELSELSLRSGGVMGLHKGEALGAMPTFSHDNASERTVEAQRDFLQFLWETEDGYWQEMRRFLKDDLKVKALVTGTIVGCTPPNMMAKMEWVDSHAYWQHPHFPGKPWDLGNWIVENKSMVNERGGILPGLAAKRVLGLPFTCTEYNHAAPNTYSSEGFLLLAAVAALQDWDAIYAYTYAHGRPADLGWDARQICGFFDLDQHPLKMATLPTAAALFVRGDLHPAKDLVVTPLPFSKEIDLLRGAHAWSLVDGISAGLPPETALLHRVALATEGRPVPPDALAPSAALKAEASAKMLVSDNGELIWDLSEAGRGVVVINTARTKAVIGFGGGKRFDLDGFVFEPGEGMQKGWSAITLSQRDNSHSDGGVPDQKRWLLTATGYAENTGMQWKNAEKSTVGRDWGKAPSRIEGVVARITLPKAWKGAEAWTLDERGQRREPLQVISTKAGLTLEIGPGARTLWFELLRK